MITQAIAQGLLFICYAVGFGLAVSLIFSPVVVIVWIAVKFLERLD